MDVFFWRKRIFFGWRVFWWRFGEKIRCFLILTQKNIGGSGSNQLIKFLSCKNRKNYRATEIVVNQKTLQLFQQKCTSNFLDVSLFKNWLVQHINQTVPTNTLVLRLDPNQLTLSFKKNTPKRSLSAAENFCRPKKHPHLGVLEIAMAKALHQFDSQLALHVGRPSTFHCCVSRQTLEKSQSWML